MLKDLEILQVLADTAQTIADCGKKIQKNVGIIMRSCHTPDTKGAAHKGLLLAKVGALKKLAALHNSADKRLRDAVRKLSNGAPEDEVLADVLVYSISLADQLKCEIEDVHRILRILKKDSSSNSAHSMASE